MPEEELETPEEKDLKTETVGFLGGVDVRLNRTLKDGKGILIDKLSDDVDKWLSQILEEQDSFIEKLSKWDRQYHSKKKDKSSPYPGAANTGIPISRSGADAIHVRTIDRIFNQFKIFLIRAKKANLVNVAPLLEDALDWWRKYSRLKQKLLSPLLEAIISGTGIVYIPWRTKKRSVTRYATPEEVADKTQDTFKLPGGRSGIKALQSQYEGPDIEGIPRKDFVISAEAKTIDTAHMVGFRTYLRRPDVELKVKQGLWYKSALDKLKVPDDYDEAEKEKVENEGKELKTEFKEPFEIWNLWFRYDVDEDGEPDDITIEYHHESKAILRCIYNPFFNGFRPFVAFKGFPRKYSFDGEGVCEILEPLQEEIDTVHNQRLDRMTQINNPIVLVREDSGLTDFKRSPGKVTIVDGEIDRMIQVVPEPGIYPGTFNEEAMLVRYAQEAIGITPQVLGQPTSERPVARETMALLQEANKKFLYVSDNGLDGVAEIGWKVLEEIAQHSPTYTYYQETEGKLEQKTVEFPSEYLRDGLELELTASKEMMSTEMRREVNLTIYQLLSDAATKLFGMVQAITSGQMPTVMVEYVLKWANVTETLLERVLKDFNQPDSKSLVVDTPDPQKIMEAIKEAQQKMQQMQQQQQRQAQAEQQGEMEQTQAKIGGDIAKEIIKALAKPQKESKESK